MNTLTGMCVSLSFQFHVLKTCNKELNLSLPIYKSISYKYTVGIKQEFSHRSNFIRNTVPRLIVMQPYRAGIIVNDAFSKRLESDKEVQVKRKMGEEREREKEKRRRWKY